MQVMGLKVYEGDRLAQEPPAIDTWNECLEALKIFLTGQSEAGFMFETVQSNFGLVCLVTGFETYCKKRFKELGGDAKDINFQNYEDCKKAFSKSLGIKFSETGFSSENIEKMKDFLKFRHRIIHVSPIQQPLNLGFVDSQGNMEEPIFSNKSLLEEAEKILDDFVQKLHKKTEEMKAKK